MTDVPEDEPSDGSFTVREVRIAAALRAFIANRNPVTEAALLEAAPDGFGQWLVTMTSRDQWARTWASAGLSDVRRLQALWHREFRRRQVLDAETIKQLQMAMDAYIHGPSAETEAALLAIAPQDDAEFYLRISDVFRRMSESDWDRVAPLNLQVERVKWDSDEVTPLRYRPGSLSPRGRWRYRRRESRPVVRGGIAASVAAAVVVLAVLLSGVVPGGSPPGNTGRVNAMPVAWRVTGFIDQPAWQPSGSAGAVGLSSVVTCPTSSVCYAQNLGRGQEPTVVEVSVDGGLSWRASALPGSWELTSELACSSATTCLAGVAIASATGGEETDGAGVVETTNQGTTWSVNPLPGSVGKVTNLACPSVGHCVGTGYRPSANRVSLGAPLAVLFSATGTASDIMNLPEPFVAASPGGLACTAAGGVCVLAGVTSLASHSPGTSAASGEVLQSTDGGRTWGRADLPSTVAKVVAVSCPSSRRCIGVGSGTSSTPGLAPYGPSEALTSGNGGSTWSLTGSYNLPASILSSLSCPTTNACWVVGITAQSRSGIIATTDNGGGSWSTVPLPTALSPAEQHSSGLTHLDIESVSSVSCPTVAICVGMATPTSLALGDQQMVLRSDGS